MSHTNNQKPGEQGEEIAVAFLESKGYTILDRNYSFERAEVDIVAYDQHKIVFIEVKTRAGTTHGRPEDAITEQKKQNIFKATEAWLYERKMDGSPVRFDVISIINEAGQAPDITHFEGAFWYRD